MIIFLEVDGLGGMKRVLVRRHVINSILSYARLCHPREGILLLRGKIKGDVIMVEDVEIPPLSVRGDGFSSFPAHMLSMDFSIIGTAHSHPSGSLQPSTEDLNHFYGRIMVIAAYPYESEADIIVINGRGEILNYEII